MDVIREDDIGNEGGGMILKDMFTAIHQPRCVLCVFENRHALVSHDGEEDLAPRDTPTTVFRHALILSRFS